MDEVPPYEVRRIIQEAMNDKGITPGDIPMEKPFDTRKQKRRIIAKTSKRYFEARGLAWFSCPRYDKQWRSDIAWCYMDLRTQTVCYRYIQGCRRCNSTDSPKFIPKALERMADFATNQFLYRSGWKAKPKKRKNGFKRTWIPHDRRRCSKCQESKWKKCYGTTR